MKKIVTVNGQRYVIENPTFKKIGVSGIFDYIPYVFDLDVQFDYIYYPKLNGVREWFRVYDDRNGSKMTFYKASYSLAVNGYYMSNSEQKTIPLRDTENEGERESYALIGTCTGFIATSKFTGRKFIEVIANNNVQTPGWISNNKWKGYHIWVPLETTYTGIVRRDYLGQESVKVKPTGGGGNNNTGGGGNNENYDIPKETSEGSSTNLITYGLGFYLGYKLLFGKKGKKKRR